MWWMKKGSRKMSGLSSRIPSRSSTKTPLRLDHQPTFDTIPVFYTQNLQPTYIFCHLYLYSTRPTTHFIGFTVSFKANHFSQLLRFIQFNYILMSLANQVDLEKEIEKLIEAYSKSKSNTRLTLEEFTELSNDLYSTLQVQKSQSKQLSKHQMQVVMNMIDKNHDGFVDKDQFLKIYEENMVVDKNKILQQFVIANPSNQKSDQKIMESHKSDEKLFIDLKLSPS